MTESKRGFPNRAVSGLTCRLGKEAGMYGETLFRRSSRAGGGRSFFMILLQYSALHCAVSLRKTLVRSEVHGRRRHEWRLIWLNPRSVVVRIWRTSLVSGASDVHATDPYFNHSSASLLKAFHSLATRVTRIGLRRWPRPSWTHPSKSWLCITAEGRSASRWLGARVMPTLASTQGGAFVGSMY